MRKIKLKYILIAIVLLAVVGIAFSLSNNGEYVTAAVTRRDLVQTVSMTGKTQAQQEAELSFERGGRVVNLPVKVGGKVLRGQIIAGLDIGTLSAELEAAEAELALKLAETANTEVNLDEVKKQWDTVVANAYRDLLSEGLEAVAWAGNYSVASPVITGIYDGPEGVYKVRVKRTDQVVLDDYELLTFNLETTDELKISEDGPTALGTRGLYISFPDDLAGYQDTSWEVAVPNTKSSLYLANYNAYQEALRDREKAIADAEAVLRSRDGSAVVEAEVAAAQAEVSRVQKQIKQMTLRAPFDGVLSRLDIELGEAVAANTVAAGFISSAPLEIEANVPEVDVAKIKTGDRGVATLDAFGAGESWKVVVRSIDPAETLIEGVPSYRTLLDFEKVDGRIRPGLTVNLLIETARREQALAIPLAAFVSRDGQHFARVLQEEGISETPIEIGLRSSDGFIEIISGLAEGDAVVTQS